MRDVGIAAEVGLLGLVALAALLGGAIGFEREEAEKPAGLRTHMLVAAAAALIVGVGRLVLRETDAASASGDPNRALHAVITGIGFLGAGTIIFDQSRHKVEGLTTATSLFMAAAIGVATAFHAYILAIGVTALVLVTLRVVSAIERRGRADDASGSDGGSPGP